MIKISISGILLPMLKWINLKPHLMYRSRSSRVEYLKFVIVIGLIVIVSLLLRSRYGLANTNDLLRWLMGTTLMVFGIFKCIGYKYFIVMFPAYDLLAKKYKLYAKSYPFFELALGVIYWFDILSVYRDIFVIILSSVGAYGVILYLRSEKKVHCACLGNVIRLPLSRVSLFENISMVAMAIAMLLI